MTQSEHHPRSLNATSVVKYNPKRSHEHLHEVCRLDVHRRNRPTLKSMATSTAFINPTTPAHMKTRGLSYANDIVDI
jgi:hypothetical protein